MKKLTRSLSNKTYRDRRSEGLEIERPSVLCNISIRLLDLTKIVCEFIIIVCACDASLTIGFATQELKLC